MCMDVLAFANAGVATPALGDRARCAWMCLLSRMPGWPRRHWEIARDVHGCACFRECRGGHAGIGRSREMCMDVLAFANAGVATPALGDRARCAWMCLLSR